MNPTIVILVDYQNRFSTKWSAQTYRSGVCKETLKQALQFEGFNVVFKKFADIDIRNENITNKVYLYGSSEDDALFYKSYIEDVIYALELKGTKLLTPFKLLRAHHNKVFMEMLRDLSEADEMKVLHSSHFGTLEEFEDSEPNVKYPVVIKDAAGASSLGVQKANNFNQAKKIIKKIARSANYAYEFKDIMRAFKHKDYRKESLYRRKFIVQEMLPQLNKDWKVLIFGTKYYILERNSKKNDFRASGSGILNYPESVPEGLFDFAETVFKSFSVPFIGIDIGLSNGKFILIEFQAIHFGSHTLDTSPYYFEKSGNKWVKVKEPSILEIEMAKSIKFYLNQ